MSTSLISCERLSKTFRRHARPQLLRQHLRDLWAPRREEKFYALKDISFEVARGESVGIVGGNGSGKSTLLALTTGLARPDEGRIVVNGRIGALLELGSGFHPDLTGAENVRLNAALLGLSRKRTTALFDSIVEFSGVADFINEPLRTYSSGMVVRLAFSVIINLDADVIIIDEVLAVGDQEFQAKCSERIHSLRESGKTLLFVSHNSASVLRLCDRALWLNHGRLVMTGSAQKIIDAYQSTLLAPVPEAL